MKVRYYKTIIRQQEYLDLKEGQIIISATFCNHYDEVEYIIKEEIK